MRQALVVASLAWSSHCGIGIAREAESGLEPTITASAPRSAQPDARGHWAFRPVADPPLPAVDNPTWIRNGIDSFVLRKLEAAGLQPSPEADRRTLVRRLHATLTGLPPEPDAVRRFETDEDPDAFTKLVDALLDSPHYGEHWARHWLDVARYSDTKGYVYAREERFWPHAWTYRDWVARALNEDMAYDRFLLLQLAADQVDDRRTEDLAAMGFLTVGRRFLGVKHDIYDDRIDVVGRGTMGLTLGCARCHDHKYDPVPIADYYSLYGVFDSCVERLVEIAPRHATEDTSFWNTFDERRNQLESTLTKRRRETSDRARERIRDYLHAQTELDRFPADGFDQVFRTTDLLPAFVRRWDEFLRASADRRDPVFVHWHAYSRLAPERFAEEARPLTSRLAATPDHTVNPLVAEAFADPPDSFEEVIDRYAALFRSVDGRWRAALKEAESNGSPQPESLDDSAVEALRAVLYGDASPCEVPDAPIVNIETFFDTDTVNELWKLQGEVERAIIGGPESAPFALTLADRPDPSTPRIFLRGSSVQRGDEVPRRFLSLLAGPETSEFRQGSGRLELAQAIVHPDNPLTARVMVNRVWLHHFGEGLVSTPSDFGTRADPPSHPELLDWLTRRFIESGWSIKRLHRLILLSSTFRQTSRGLETSATPGGMPGDEIDPSNRLLWRMNARRLGFEELRDAMMAASGDLDRRIGGKPVDLFSEPFATRRAVYGLVDRQFLPGVLRTFDFANPDLHIPRRNETTVPQQALFLLNHELVLERARVVAARSAEAGPDPDARIEALFARILQRRPTRTEHSEALAFVREVAAETSPAQPETSAEWQYGIGAFDEETGRVADFRPLPHFTGDAWQGGPTWPDATLGWARLSASGGHPGNDRSHAVVRRWTAPRDTLVSIRTSLRHEPTEGDGIRAFIAGSRAGLLRSASIHADSTELHVDALMVRAGETIDFVTDIGNGLNSDQFLWSITLTEQQSGAPDAPPPVVWSSESDFSGPRAEPLDGWELLAQALLCSNEFLFVD